MWGLHATGPPGANEVVGRLLDSDPALGIHHRLHLGAQDREAGLDRYEDATTTCGPTLRRGGKWAVRAKRPRLKSNRPTCGELQPRKGQGAIVPVVFVRIEIFGGRVAGGAGLGVLQRSESIGEWGCMPVRAGGTTFGRSRRIVL